MQELWQRRDWLSSIELLTIADAIQKTNASRRWLKARERDIKGARIGSNTGYLFELLVASFLHNPPRQCAYLAEDPQQVGYDVKLKVGEKTVRVSCKSVGLSDLEKQFISINQEIERSIQCFARHYSFNAVLEWPQSPSIDYLEPLRTQVKIGLDEMFRRTTRGAIGVWNGTNHDRIWQLWLSRYTPSQLHLRQSDIEHSYRFTAWSMRIENETGRVINTLKRAFSQMKDKCGIGDEIHSNLVAIRLPEASNLNDVKNWCERSFLHEYSAIGGVLLLRGLPSLNLTSDLWSLTWEIAYVQNNNAVHPLPSITNIKVPIGQFGNPRRVLRVNGESIDLNASFIYQAGREVYDVRKTYFHMSDIPPGITMVVNVTLPGSNMIRIQAPPFRADTQLI